MYTIYIMITNKIKYMLHECYIISANNDTINLSAISLLVLCEKCLHCYRKKVKLKRIHRLYILYTFKLRIGLLQKFMHNCYWLIFISFQKYFHIYLLFLRL